MSQTVQAACEFAGLIKDDMPARYISFLLNIVASLPEQGVCRAKEQLRHRLFLVIETI
ncbi:hypothetical protein [Fulvimarina sp. MAC8]|uniref:hypothetical protein n=1 Tax=Fulvimarina sp. MAC8 TaxID=3162874 RepID=UPI0032ECBFC2